MTLTKLQEIIMRYDKLPLECDGMTRVLSYVLSELEIGHVVITGILSGPYGSIPHYWIQIEDGKYIDLRCRMWQGKEDDNIPHGVFNPNDYTLVAYDISKTEQWEVPETIYQILTGTTKLLEE